MTSAAPSFPADGAAWAPLPDVTLTPALTQLLQQISDPAVRQRTHGIASYAVMSLQQLGRIHLPQDHFEEHTVLTGSAQHHLELVPYVLAAVESINALVGYILAHVEADPVAEAAVDDDMDIAFDVVDAPAQPAAGKPSAKRELSDGAVRAYASMLGSRLQTFGSRLERALSQGDSWFLLAELDDNKHRLTKSVQGLLFGVLTLYEPQLVREAVLPSYRSAVSEAVQLRAALSELTYHVGRFNAALSKVSSEEALPLMVGLADRLSRFSTRAEFRALRADDKKAVIDFRRALHDLRHGAQSQGVAIGPLRQAVEGFSKFLEAMHAINHREVLVLHDRARLREASQALETALQLPPAEQRLRLDEIVEALQGVQGRSPELDEARRSYGSQAVTDLQGALARWQALVESVAATVM